MNETNENVNVNVETTGTEEENNNQEGRFYTNEEIELIKQQAGDKRITQYQKKMDKQIESKIAEATKLAKMSDMEKFQYEMQQREELLAAKEKELALYEMKNECQKALANKGLDINLADLCLNEDADVTNYNIRTLEKAFNTAVRTEVAKRLSAKSPANSIAKKGNITKNEFNKMNYAQRMQLKAEDEDLYYSLVNS